MSNYETFRDRTINHQDMREQIDKQGVFHTSTVNKVDISVADSEYIKRTSQKIATKMVETGYIGAVGLDYIVSDKCVFPVENNARFNGSSYVSMIADTIEKLTTPIQYWKFIKIKTAACSFTELIERIKPIIYDGERLNSVFPYNCDILTLTGNFSVVIFAENMNQIIALEKSLNEMWIGV